MNPKPPRPDELLDRLLDDETKSREEHAAEVVGMGYDFAALERRLSSQIDAHAAAARRARLDRAAAARQRAARSASGTLERIRTQKLPEAELRRQVSQRQADVAHRELEGWSREDLESELADLMDLEGEPPDDVG